MNQFLSATYYAGMNALFRLTIVIAGLSCAAHDNPGTSDSPSSDPAAVPEAARFDSGAPRLDPRDEANPSFREFRDRTLAAIARKDTAYLHGMVSSDIRTSFGDGGGLAGFKRMWHTETSFSTVWATLERILRLGGRQTSDTAFFAPYVYAFWPDSIDAFTHVAVTSPNAAVHVRPDTQSDVLGRAGYSILRAAEWTARPGDVAPSDTSWVRVELPQSRSGWLRVADVYSPVSWRAAFVRRGDRWVMILFVAGD